MTIMNLINYDNDDEFNLLWGEWSFTSKYIYVIILFNLLIMSFYYLIEYSSNYKFIMSYSNVNVVNLCY